MSVQVDVLESTSMRTFDIICPRCGYVIHEGYGGKRSRFSMKCPDCNMRIYEYSAIAIEPGATVDEGTIHKVLKRYWDSQVSLGREDAENYHEEANKIGLSWNPA